MEPKVAQNEGPNLRQLVESQFSKHFTLPCKDAIVTIQDKVLPWEDPEMMKLKDQLNTTKSLLNDLPLSKWHNHTKNQNPAGNVVEKVRKVAAKPELLTQAWCKFAEICHRFDLIDGCCKNYGSAAAAALSFKTVHLCEAPGAFITSLNHQIRTKSEFTNWRWTGTTFNPYHEANSTSSMVNDDRFLLYTLDNWDFGVDDTGDLTKKENILHLCERLGSETDLVTADGSVDCQGDPGQQEAIVSRLHLAEVASAFGLLKNSGNFVIKMFTFYESETICLMFLLTRTFEKVDVFKPATSKEGNSEVYVICRNFMVKNMTSEALKKLVDRATNSDRNPLFSKETIGDFLYDLKKCSTFFKDLQEAVIQRNLENFDTGAKIPHQLKIQVANEFIRKCGIKPIPSQHRLIPWYQNKPGSAGKFLQLDPRLEPLTFSSRFQVPDHNDVEGKTRYLRDKLAGFMAFDKMYQIRWCSKEKLPDIKLNFRRGSSIKVIQSSKFCPSGMIRVFKEVCDFSKYCQKSQDCDWPALPAAKRIRKNPGEEEIVQVDNSRIHADFVPEMKGDVQKLNFKLKEPHLYLESCLSVNGSVRLFIDSITDSLKTIRRGENIMMNNYPLFTRLLLGIFVALANSFEEIGFVRPERDRNLIILSKFAGDATKSLEVLNSIRDELEIKNDHDLLEVLHIGSLCDDPLYSMTVETNYLALRERGYAMLSNVYEGRINKTD